MDERKTKLVLKHLMIVIKNPECTFYQSELDGRKFVKFREEVWIKIPKKRCYVNILLNVYGEFIAAATF